MLILKINRKKVNVNITRIIATDYNHFIFYSLFIMKELDDEEKIITMTPLFSFVLMTMFNKFYKTLL